MWQQRFYKIDTFSSQIDSLVFHVDSLRHRHDNGEQLEQRIDSFVRFRQRRQRRKRNHIRQRRSGVNTNNPLILLLLLF